MTKLTREKEREYIRALQHKINTEEQLAVPLVEDGIYGPITSQATIDTLNGRKNNVTFYKSQWEKACDRLSRRNLFRRFWR